MTDLAAEAHARLDRAHYFTYDAGADPAIGQALATEAVALAVLALVDQLAALRSTPSYVQPSSSAARGAREAERSRARDLGVSLPNDTQPSAPVAPAVPVEQLITEWFDLDMAAMRLHRKVDEASQLWRDLVPSVPGVYRFGQWQVVVDADGNTDGPTVIESGES